MKLFNQLFNRIYLALFCQKHEYEDETYFTAPGPFMYRYITSTKHGYIIEFYDGSHLVGSKFRTHKQLLFDWQDLSYCLQSYLNSRFVLIIRKFAFDRCLKLYTRFFDCQRQYLIEISQKTEAEILWSYFLAQDLLRYRLNAHNSTRQQQILLKIDLWLSHSEIPSSTRRSARDYIMMELRVPISFSTIVESSELLFSNKPPGCHKCLYFYGKSYNNQILICGIHPFGLNNCPDFEPNH